MSIGEHQKPVTEKYRDHYDDIFKKVTIEDKYIEFTKTLSKNFQLMLKELKEKNDLSIL